MKRTDTRLAWTSDPEEARGLRSDSEHTIGADAPPATQTLRVTLDRKRRKGKTVTVVSGFTLTEPSLNRLTTDLKKRCGAGGTSKEAEIEIQGEHLDLITTELERRGFRIKH